jgi:phytoene synthase
MSDSSAAAQDSFAAFRDKWLQAHPEQRLVAVFLAPAERRIAAAFGSLVHEIERSTFAVREPQVAAAKLEWWREELVRAAATTPRHPIARELVAAAPQTATWVGAAQALPAAASGMIELAPPSSLDAAFRDLSVFYQPVALLEASLHGHADACGPADAELWIAAHLLRSAAEPALQASQTPPLPLDLFARHGISAAGLAEPGAARTALLADFTGALARRLELALPAARSAAVGTRVRARLDRHMAASAARQRDPAAFLARAAPGGLRIVSAAWREARAAQRRGDSSVRRA